MQDTKEAGLKNVHRDMDGSVISGTDETGKVVTFPKRPILAPPSAGTAAVPAASAAATPGATAAPAFPKAGPAPLALAPGMRTGNPDVAFQSPGSSSQANTATGAAAGASLVGAGSTFPRVADAGSGAAPAPVASGLPKPPPLTLPPGIRTGNPDVSLPSAADRAAAMNATATAAADAVKQRAQGVLAGRAAFPQPTGPSVPIATTGGDAVTTSRVTGLPTGQYANATSFPGQNAGAAAPTRIADETGDRTAEFAGAPATGFPRPRKPVVVASGY